MEIKARYMNRKWIYTHYYTLSLSNIKWCGIMLKSLHPVELQNINIMENTKKMMHLHFIF